jgi:4,5-dihydroxyphthalate decarboxylase
MHSTLVIKDQILKANPGLAQNIFNAFLESKQIYVDRLRSGATGGKNDARYIKQMKVVGEDPLPYGLEVNRRSIETLALYAHQQGLTPRQLSVDDLFLNINA